MIMIIADDNCNIKKEVDLKFNLSLVPSRVAIDDIRAAIEQRCHKKFPIKIRKIFIINVKKIRLIKIELKYSFLISELNSLLNLEYAVIVPNIIKKENNSIKPLEKI